MFSDNTSIFTCNDALADYDELWQRLNLRVEEDARLGNAQRRYQNCAGQCQCFVPWLALPVYMMLAMVVTMPVLACAVAVEMPMPASCLAPVAAGNGVSQVSAMSLAEQRL